jgi:hypothetical protein
MIRPFPRAGALPAVRAELGAWRAQRKRPGPAGSSGLSGPGLDHRHRGDGAPVAHIHIADTMNPVPLISANSL